MVWIEKKKGQVQERRTCSSAASPLPNHPGFAVTLQPRLGMTQLRAMITRSEELLLEAHALDTVLWPWRHGREVLTELLSATKSCRPPAPPRAVPDTAPTRHPGSAPSPPHHHAVLPANKSRSLSSPVGSYSPQSAS